jgi:hypothetical protein
VKLESDGRAARWTVRDSFQLSAEKSAAAGVAGR